MVVTGVFGWRESTITLLKETIAKSRRNERLVDALKRKLARQANDFEAELKKLKMEMTAGLKETMEEKERLVRELKKIENSEELMKDEIRMLKPRNEDLECKAVKDATDIRRLNREIRLLNSTKKYILNKNLDLELRAKSSQSKPLV